MENNYPDYPATWNVSTQRSENRSFFLRLALTSVALKRNRDINYFLFFVYHIIFESMSASCSITSTGIHTLLQWSLEMAEHNLL